MDFILVKLNKLEEIDAKLDGDTKNVKCLEVKLKSLTVELQKTNDTQAMQESNINHIEQSAQFNDNRLDTAEANIAKVKQDSQDSTEQINKKLLYLEVYSTRENLNSQEYLSNSNN